MDLRVCATPDKVALTPFALDIAKFALHYYDDYFGIHFPLKKLDLIGDSRLRSRRHGELRRHHLPRDRSAGRPQNRLHSPTRRNAALAITHEMAHQWFGDLVTMQWWDNVWLNEGFATWMENKPVAAMHPEWNIPRVGRRRRTGHAQHRCAAHHARHPRQGRHAG